MAGEEKQRDERAKRLREEIDRLRSGAETEATPKSPREFLDRAAREGKRSQSGGGKKGDEDRG
jgi:hypothetical protein